MMERQTLLITLICKVPFAKCKGSLCRPWKRCTEGWQTCARLGFEASVIETEPATLYDGRCPLALSPSGGEGECPPDTSGSDGHRGSALRGKTFARSRNHTV